MGPRVFNPTGPGYIHAYCRTPKEKRAKANALADIRKRRREGRARDKADAADQFAKDKARFFPEPPEVLA